MRMQWATALRRPNPANMVGWNSNFYNPLSTQPDWGNNDNS